METLDSHLLEKLPQFKARMDWFLKNRPNLVRHAASFTKTGMGERLLLSIVNRDKLESILKRTLDTEQFLSTYGLRSLSKEHETNPFTLQLNGISHTVRYEPAESSTNLFGGNSNWRGPIWFPLNYLIIESLEKYHYYYGNKLKVELPTGSNRSATLQEVADDIAWRLSSIFLQNKEGKRAFYGSNDYFQTDPHWRNHILFNEYFQGDTGAGIGASHQTGWTALVAKLIQNW